MGSDEHQPAAADIGQRWICGVRRRFIGRWQWNILADAMDHQGCLSELKGVGRGGRYVKKGAKSSDDPGCQ